MAGRPDEELSDAAQVACVDDDDARLNELGLDDCVRSKMNAIQRDYESIFSWDLMEHVKFRSPMMNQLDKMREKYNLKVLGDVTSFDLQRFCLKLIISYELYIEGNYKDSLLEMESIVKSIKLCECDQSDEFSMDLKYFDACNHIARASNSYIALTLNLDTEKIIKNVKPKNSLSQSEIAAIHTIKARILMKYPPKGNIIALECADAAIELLSTEPVCLSTWLRAKGRVRRYNYRYLKPEKKEIDVADMLFATNKTCFLIQACYTYNELAFLHKIENNRKESYKYYELSSEIILKAVELASLPQLISCFQIYINCPEQFRSKTVMDELILKLSRVKNYQVYQTLGHYYKNEKNYEKAKLYLTEGTKAGHFYSYMELIKVECILKTVQEYPIVQTLNMMYDVFPGPKRRLIILSQILMYYYYYGNNPKDIMKYMDKYLDQETDDASKKLTLKSAFPIFNVKGYFKKFSFLRLLFDELKDIKCNQVGSSSNETKAIDEIYDRFLKMYQTRVNEYESSYNETSIHIQNYNQIKRHFNKEPHNTHEKNWQKQEYPSNNVLNKYHQHPTTSKCIVENENNVKTDYSKTNFNSELKDSNNIYTKFDKFKINPISKSGIHDVFVDNNYNSRTNQYGNQDTLPWRSPQEINKNQDVFSFNNNRNKFSKYDRKDMNLNWRNQHKVISKDTQQYNNQDSSDSS